jgi:hypothetical protein
MPQNMTYKNSAGDRNLWLGALAGAAGGLAATVAMDVVSRLWSVGSRGKLTPNEESLSEQGGRPDVEAAKKAGLHAGDSGAVATTIVAERIAGKPLSPKQRMAGGKTVHYCYGAAMGALYGAGVEYVPAVKSQNGLLYGLALWLGGVQVALPAFGLAAPPHKYSAGEQLFSVVSHAVFGVVAEATRNQIRT